jgi:hypothetical protein
MSRYWFPAKRYGWGWGLPVVWQGWAVLVVFMILMISGAFLCPPNVSLVHFFAYVIVLSALFAGICWLKGEPPHWRWGDDR